MRGFQKANSCFQILQLVVSYLNDQDLNSLALSSPRVLAVRLLPENAGQWKERFLSLYDEPILEGPHEYCVAYRHRRYVMRKFKGCGGGDKKALEGMQVIRDMIIGKIGHLFYVQIARTNALRS